ncbi:MFS transporter [Streptomyces phaeochromogenes]
MSEPSPTGSAGTAHALHAPSPDRHPLRPSLVLVLGSLTALGPLTIDLYLPALPEVSGDLHVSQAVTQLTLTAFMTGIALGQLVIGPLSDTLGRRRPLLTGLTVYVAASLLCTVAPNPTVLIGMRLVQGLAGAAGIVIARAIVRPVRRTRRRPPAVLADARLRHGTSECLPRHCGQFRSSHSTRRCSFPKDSLTGAPPAPVEPSATSRIPRPPLRHAEKDGLF